MAHIERSEPRSAEPAGWSRRRFAGALAGAAALLPLVALDRAARAAEPRASGTPGQAGKPEPAGAGAAAGFTPEQAAQLERAKFVYISSTRKDGSPSQPAEIWFMVSDGALWVASKPSSWRAKRIRWGRPMATIWIGSRSGPSFRARGEIVKDPRRYDELCARYAAKYADGWPRWERSFRDGLPSGERVLIRYAPVAG